MNKPKQTKQLIKDNYLADNRPLVVTFSGGKDSTVVLQLTIEVLLELQKKGLDKKEVYILSSDTLVEMPIIESYLSKTLIKVDNFAKKANLNIKTKLIRPKIDSSFFSLMIGKGYPAPNRWFRWCTDRLKIRPATNYLNDLVGKHQSILMLLGVRSAESANRAKSIADRELNYRGLSMHDQIPNAYILSPIKDWSDKDVWNFVANNPPPWGSHEEMIKLYSKGATLPNGEVRDGEADCNIALNPEAPSCGKTRFGCWTCTVVDKDKSMDGMIQSGEEWMKPLWDYREKLLEYRDREDKRNKRRKNGHLGLGDFKLETRKELLSELLKIESSKDFRYKDVKLISDDELKTIQKFWNIDGDIENSALKIAQKFERLKQLNIKNSHLKELISEYKDRVDINLFERIYEIEVHRKNISNRYAIINDIEERTKNYFKGQFIEN